MPDRILDARSLRFVDPALERVYQFEAVGQIRREAAGGSAVSVVLWLVAGLLLPIATTIQPAISTPLVLGIALLDALALLPIRRAQTLDGALRVILGLNVATCVVLLVLAAESGQFERYAAPAIILQSIFAFLIARSFLLTLVAAAAEFGALATVAGLRGPPSGYLLDLFIVAAALGVGVGITWVIESAARTAWYQRRLIEAQRAELAGEKAALAIEKATSDRLLRNVLPDSIVDRLSELSVTIADGVEDATVLFADLVGFTPLSSRLPPTEIVRVLDQLFGEFDALTDRYGVEKIKTIGDAYMAAGGVPEPLADHAIQVVRLGLAMLATTHGFADREGLPLELRVGVHSGPVVAGVIGRRRFSYDLWGDTVNTASRMESHGVVGAVQVTQATRNRLGPSFQVTPRGVIDVKGKGPLEAFLVTGED